MLEAFSQAWANAWCTALIGSPRYREVAAEWEGAVGLLLDGDSGEPGRAVVLDLWHGDCRSARAVEAGEIGEPDFVFRASAEGWRRIFEGHTPPVAALMSGRLRLVKGDLSRLLPYAQAARELLELAAGIPATFPVEKTPEIEDKSPS